MFSSSFPLETEVDNCQFQNKTLFQEAVESMEAVDICPAGAEGPRPPRIKTAVEF